MTLEINSPAYSSLPRRAAALLIDGLILGALVALGGSLIPVLGGIVVWFLYAPILESSEVQATIGKYLMGIQVADLLGRRISLRTAVIRNLMKIISATILLIGFIFALFNSKKQTLHDLLADTIVVYGHSEVPMIDAWLNRTKEFFRVGKANLNSLGSGPLNDSIVDQLERLSELHAKKALTDEQYEAAKSKVLK